ncbi:PEP/pyruvate-binding domain-containing protein [Methanolobus profundi]|uniref:Pyruvate, water dikinase n=1 Tax=Methanolobus profundi TaxID=487685 RepID=A0A1I4PPQ4_9EURY|nr:PEP/pyruvate-binding domain-containing protein [Methanolobus profundi]SFM29470.1 pyruvate, water dikinase [Methanolobus profundi]
MKELVIPMENIQEEHRDLIGSKAFSLHSIFHIGFNVPSYICITTNAYERYLNSSSLKGRIILELSRKDISDMRWEEMWDTSLRIRNMFLNTPIPNSLASDIRKYIAERFTDTPVVVRSSAPGEDSSQTSFAGLHESYVNIRGTEAILEHIRLVWASLWSDAAILYRKELGLDIKHSKMAVLVQELIAGDVSGIIFSSSPENKEQLVIEAIHGLNKGLVDGDIEPDRWSIDRRTASIDQYSSPSGRNRIVHLRDSGTSLESSSDELSRTVPLDETEIHRLHSIAMELESSFGHPQDIEWTKKDNELYILQSRPITTADDEEKLWYLSLRRNMNNLKQLRLKIENELIPEMIEDARILGSVDTGSMNNEELAGEIIRRKELYDNWDKRYTDEFIPFAHGMRLFGQVYNDMVRPSDPYEFMGLLSGSGLLSIKRNKRLGQMADILRTDPSRFDKIMAGSIDDSFEKEIDTFLEDFGHSGSIGNRDELLKLITEMASRPEKKIPVESGHSDVEEKFFSSFPEKDRAFAEELLDIGRISYRLRDDDNIYLGRIEHQYLLSLDEAKRRLADRIEGPEISNDIELQEILKALNNETYVPVISKMDENKKTGSDSKLFKRQIQGQPAGKGLVTGIAHVIDDNKELFNVRSGEILVCDAIDPNMTFIVPIVSGIVERRGGMLIHGAIIAREYGIPCVTGIPDATMVIMNGDEVTVDGYLGIVTIKRK